MIVQQNTLHGWTVLLAAGTCLSLTACQSSDVPSRSGPSEPLPAMTAAAIVQSEPAVADQAPSDAVLVMTETPAPEQIHPPVPAPADDPRGPIVHLDAYSVMAEPPKLSFGLALQIWQTGHEAKVGILYITRVRENSDAAEQGLVPGTRIDKVDGRNVLEFTANFKSGGELHAAFINRKIGSQVELEVLLPHTTEPRKVVLVERLNVAF